MPLGLPARFLALLVLVLVGAGVGAQPAPTADGPLPRLTAALEAGDAEALLDGSAPRVELVLFERSGLYSRGQAALVLAGFFRRHPPSRVVLAEESIADDGRAALGRYWTATGEAPLRVYVRLRPAAESDGPEAQWEVDAVRIERGALQNIGGLR